ncbi:uncharacterized protein [Diadema setosum]|uniref:uncharacterized protein n=1 Tax=Diadema setosum TaxID=31175 RepID=UPI003B3AE175
MRSGEDNHLIAFVLLEFEPRLPDDDRREVIKVLYEIVERNHTLGTLTVNELHVMLYSDKYVQISDACKITGCPREMSCTSVGNECIAVCANNTDYCLNDAECVDESFPVTCTCRKDFSGPRCGDKMSDDDHAKTNLYVGIIAASSIAGIIVLAIIAASCINLFNKRGGRTGKSDELFGIENVVALELSDEKIEIDGIGTQTDESFLLARSHKDGVPPKQGCAHKIMQTNDSFLLTKAQLLRSHGVVSHNRGAGSPVGVVSANTGRLSGPNSSRVIEGGATPSTSSSSAANGKPRKASTKKERAPSSPDVDASTSKSDAKTLPTTSGKSEQPTPSQESAPTRSDDKKAEHRVDELTNGNSQNGAENDVKKPSQVNAGQSNVGELYPGRKILKV